MAAQRPNVIVYQEYKTLTVTPDIPDLEALIVGECFQILDYLDDKEMCEASEYGTLNSPVPLVDPTAVIISDPPNVVAGGQLDDASVKIYFDAARAVIAESFSPAPGNSEAIYTTGDNLLEGHNLAGGVHFGALHVEPGDIAIVQAFPLTLDDHIMTVKELCYTLYDRGAGLPGFITSGVQPDDIVTLSSDTLSPSRNGTYIVKRVVSEEALEVVSASWGGDITGHSMKMGVTDPTGAPRFTAATTTISDFCNLRMTSDFETTGAAGNALNWRIERAVSDQLMETTDFTVTGNQVTVKAARTIDLDYSTYSLTCKVSYAKIYMAYCALRTDLQMVVALSNTTEILERLGKFDARNPLCVGAITAKSNTSTGINIYGTSGATNADYLDFIDRVSTNQDIYAIAPLTYDSSILSSLVTMARTLADPNEALTNGFRQKFRMIIGAVDLQTTKYMVTTKGGASSSVKAGTAPSALKQYTLSTTGTGTFAGGHYTDGTLPGDTVIITDTVTPATYTLTVAQTNGEQILEADQVSPWGAPPVTLTALADKIEYFHPDDLVTPYLSYSPDGGLTFPDIIITPSALDNLYLVLDCPGANFLTQGCIPGDYLQLPYDPTINSWTSGTVRTFVIDEVISNQRVRVTNEGTNTSTVENELPHGGNRVTGAEITSGALYMRVMRSLTKDQQVSEMVAVAQSLSDKRLILAYPDLVDVTDLVDGSKDPIENEDGSTTYPPPADSQPGYYLSCAVAGQTAGNPPQQGFTNMGIAGISRIYNSSDYFTEQQMTDLSNGGVYVFMQENENSLPYTIHEVTTDVSMLQFAEYMVVKDFDFVAWTFLDTLLPFLGEWNVNPQTIEFIRQALFTTADVLKSRYVAKIGAPLVDYTLDSVEISDLSPDRIEAYMQVSLPMTLNTIGLHLVA